MCMGQRVQERHVQLLVFTLDGLGRCQERGGLIVKNLFQSLHECARKVD